MFSTAYCACLLLSALIGCFILNLQLFYYSQLTLSALVVCIYCYELYVAFSQLTRYSTIYGVENCSFVIASDFIWI